MYGHLITPPILQLSQELIDEIIDDTPELKDLKSLSLVCHAFHPRCEKHIFASVKFSDIVVGWRKRTERIQEFIHILSRKPYIARYVRELHLGVEGRDQEWMVEDRDFLKIMNLIRFEEKKIVNLRRLSVHHLLHRSCCLFASRIWMTYPSPWSPIVLI